MKFTIDKNYTASYQMDRVKKDIQSFKESFKGLTEKDFLGHIVAQLENVYPEKAQMFVGEDVLRCDINAFPAGSYYNDVTTFEVTIVTEGWKEMGKIHCYFDPETWTVDTRVLNGCTKMYTIQRYALI